MSATWQRTHIDVERLTGIRERRVSVGDEGSFTAEVDAVINCTVAHAIDVDNAVTFDLSCVRSNAHRRHDRQQLDPVRKDPPDPGGQCEYISQLAASAPS